MRAIGKFIWFIKGVLLTSWRMIFNPSFRDDVIRSLNDISEYYYD